MKLTKNFKSREFIYFDFFEDYQRDVIEDFNIDSEELLPNLQKLANQLQVLRDYIGKPIYINAGFRPVWWEHLRGRSGSSQHTLCKAADIRVKGMTPDEVADTIEYLISNGDMLQGGLGRYDNFIHYDIGFNGKKRRWDNRS
jgi:uncharacterized protein YcbK (DUF882 family)